MSVDLRTNCPMIVKPVMHMASSVIIVPIYMAACAVIITATAAMQCRMLSVADDCAHVVIAFNVPTVSKISAELFSGMNL